MTCFEPTPIPDGRIDLGGRVYMSTADGGMMPVELIRPMDLLKDEVVRKIMRHGLALSQQVSRFLGHTFDDIGSLEALIGVVAQL